MDNIGYLNTLSYKEAKEIHDGNQETIKKVVDITNNHILEQIEKILPKTMNYDKAFCIQCRILDGMNVVAKINDIQVELHHIEIPITDKIDISNMKKLNFKQRMKILFKGEL